MRLAQDLGPFAFEHRLCVRKSKLRLGDDAFAFGKLVCARLQFALPGLERVPKLGHEGLIVIGHFLFTNQPLGLQPGTLDDGVRIGSRLRDDLVAPAAGGADLIGKATSDDGDLGSLDVERGPGTVE